MDERTKKAIVIGVSQFAFYFGLKALTPSRRSSQKIISLPAGIIQTPFQLQSNTRLQGQGIDKTIITGSGDIISAVEASNITVSDLTLSGSPTDNGLSFYSVTNSLVQNVKSVNNKLKGFVLADACQNIVFDHVEAGYNEQDGLAVASGTIASGRVCRNITVRSSWTHDNVMYGVGIVTPTINYLQPENITVDDCMVSSNGLYGIEVKGAKNPVITRNTVRWNKIHGIDLGVVSDFKVTGARVENNTVTGNLSNGIRCQLAADSVIDHNVCTLNDVGIGYNSGENVRVTNNDLRRNMSLPLLIVNPAGLVQYGNLV